MLASNVQEDQHINALDGLRGLAALTVMVSHFTNKTGFLGDALGWGAGKVGVMVFFSLSGFLMAHLYLSSPPTGRNVADFLVRRFARVIPLYIAVIVVAFFFWVLLEFPPMGYDVNRENLLPRLLLLNAEGIVWTVQVEVQFYLLFPIIWLISSWFGVHVAWPLSILLVLACVFPSPELPGIVAYGQVFILGILIYLACQRIPPLPNWVLPLALIVYVATFPVLMLDYYGIDAGHPSLVFWSPLYLAITGLLLIATVKSRSAEYLLGNRFGRWLGRVSYSLYLLHLPILGLVLWAMAGQSVWLMLLVFLASTAVVAELSFRLIERPARSAVASLRIRRRPGLAT